jgi:hypothetical protein
MSDRSTILPTAALLPHPSKNELEAHEKVLEPPSKDLNVQSDDQTRFSHQFVIFSYSFLSFFFFLRKRIVWAFLDLTSNYGPFNEIFGRLPLTSQWYIKIPLQPLAS